MISASPMGCSDLADLSVTCGQTSSAILAIATTCCSLKNLTKSVTPSRFMRSEKAWNSRPT